MPQDVLLPCFPPYRVERRLTYREKEPVPAFRWCVLDWRGQIYYIGDPTDRTVADIKAATLNGAGVTP